MKGYFLVLFCTLFFADSLFVSCEKSATNTPTDTVGNGLQVQEVNRALLMDFSETWCPPCGTYGGPTFDSCLVLSDTLLNAVKVYASSVPATLNAPISLMWNQLFNAATVPALYVNNSMISLTPMIDYNFRQIQILASQFKNSQVKAGLALSKVLKSDSLIVDARVKFFRADSAGVHYQLGVYVLEDSIVATQALSNGSQDSLYVHRHLLRGSSVSTVTGISINASVAVIAGQKFDSVHRFFIDPTWKFGNLKVLGVIWKTGIGTPVVINSFLLN